MLKHDRRSRALRQEALYGFAQGRLSIERLQAKLWRIDNEGSRAAWWEPLSLVAAEYRPQGAWQAPASRFESGHASEKIKGAAVAEWVKRLREKLPLEAAWKRF